MATKPDEIVEEIRKLREAHAAALGNDLRRITEDFQRLEKQSGRKVVSRQPRRPSALQVLRPA
jgi:hypothetical protein